MSLKNPKTIGEKLFQLRILHNYRQKDVADKVGISRVTLNQYENNRRMPTPKALSVISNFYGIDPTELTIYLIKQYK